VKILITGGTGYLGLRLIEYFLSDKKNKIYITSRRNKKINITGIENNFILSNSKNNLPPLKKIDLIIHAAGPNAAEAKKKGKIAISESKCLTKIIIKYALENKVSKIIYISTAHVYKSPLIGVFNEKSKTNNIHPYALCNLVGEKEILKANKKNNLNGIIVRLSNAFGRPIAKTNDCWTLLINDITRQLVLTGKICLKGNGSEKRDFISIENTCRALEHISKLKTKRKIFNVGGNWTPTTYEISKIVSSRYKKITGLDSEILINKKNRTQISNDVDHLKYQIDNLLNSGFVLKNRTNIKEIDELIKFCIKNSL
tara:strand:- start:1169 stop:2107 length:939 start_codon:yes stop_codon:yes gene_type:complete